MNSTNFFALAQWVMIHGYAFMFTGMFVEGPLITAAASFGAALGYFNLTIVAILSLLGDILADLMHFCKRRGYSFDEILARARGYFEEEIA